MEENTPVFRLAMTQTLLPKFHKQNIIIQLNTTRPVLFKWLTNFRVYIFTYTVELTKQGNVHYHGTVHFHNKIDMLEFQNYYNDCIKDILGFSLIKPITNLDNWTEYITKDLIQTRNRFQALYEHRYINTEINLKFSKINKILELSNFMEVKKLFSKPMNISPECQLADGNEQIRLQLRNELVEHLEIRQQ